MTEGAGISGAPAAHMSPNLRLDVIGHEDRMVHPGE
jgi:hypothetical protein